MFTISARAASGTYDALRSAFGIPEEEQVDGNPMLWWSVGAGAVIAMGLGPSGEATVILTNSR